MAPRLVQKAASTLQRMIGFAAGLPQQPLVDNGKLGGGSPLASGAIPLRGEAPSDYQRSGTTVRQRGFERHPVVQACVRAIVEIAAAVDIEFYKKRPLKSNRQNTTKREVVSVLPSTFDGQRLLDAPSPFLSPYRLRALTFTHYLVYGNAFWFLERPLPAGGVGIANSPGRAENTQPPEAIRLVHPEKIHTVWVNVAGYPLWYMWSDDLGYTHTSPVTDFVHFRDLNAKGLVFGYPRAASALNDIIGDDEASQFVRQAVTNYGAPPAYALTKEDMAQEDLERAEELLYEKTVKRGERGRFRFLSGISDIKTVAFNLRDMEFPDLRRVSREDICAAFGVDPRMVGITSASRDAGLSGTQYTEARKRLVQQTIEPTMRGHESELNFWLAPEFGDCYCRYDREALKSLIEDDDQTSTRVREEVKASLRTIEEGREALDLPAEFEIDDLLVVATTVAITPASLAAGAQPQVDPATGQVLPSSPTAPQLLPSGTTLENPTDEGTASQDPAQSEDLRPLQATANRDPNNPTRPVKLVDDGTVSNKTKRSASLHAIAPVIYSTWTTPAGPVLTRSVVLTRDDRRLLWQQFDQRASADESVYRRTAQMLFAEERANTARIVARAGERATSSGQTDDVAAIKSARRELRHAYKPGGDVEKRWSDRFHGPIGATYSKGATQVATSLRANRPASTRAAGGPRKSEHAPEPPAPTSIAYTFHLTDPNVQQAIRDRSDRLARNVSSTTGEAIDDAMSLALAQGMNIRETAQLIDALAFGTGASDRSMKIARTETVGALNQGQYDAATMSGAVAGKEWLTQGDERVRDSHEACEAEGMIPLDEIFSNGCKHPGDENGDAEEVINCRCSLLYYDTLDVGASTLGH